MRGLAMGGQAENLGYWSLCWRILRSCSSLSPQCSGSASKLSCAGSLLAVTLSYRAAFMHLWAMV